MEAVRIKRHNGGMVLTGKHGVLSQPLFVFVTKIRYYSSLVILSNFGADRAKLSRKPGS